MSGSSSPSGRNLPDLPPDVLEAARSKPLPPPPSLQHEVTAIFSPDEVDTSSSAFRSNSLLPLEVHTLPPSVATTAPLAAVSFLKTPQLSHPSRNDDLGNVTLPSQQDEGAASISLTRRIRSTMLPDEISLRLQESNPPKESTWIKASTPPVVAPPTLSSHVGEEGLTMASVPVNLSPLNAPAHGMEPASSTNSTDSPGNILAAIDESESKANQEKERKAQKQRMALLSLSSTVRDSEVKPIGKYILSKSKEDAFFSSITSFPPAKRQPFRPLGFTSPMWSQMTGNDAEWSPQDAELVGVSRQHTLGDEKGKKGRKKSKKQLENSEGQDSDIEEKDRAPLHYSETPFAPFGPVGTIALLSVTIHGMSKLHPDVSVTHPFVRVWLLNGTTGESLTVTESGQMPFAVTHPVDLRLRRTRVPWWGAELPIHVCHGTSDVASNAVLLLEILDTEDESIQGFRVRHNKLYPICWGFLKLHDAHGRLNFRERMHIQMFPFPQRASLFTRILQQFLPFSLSHEAVWAETGAPPPTPSPSPETPQAAGAANNFTTMSNTNPIVAATITGAATTRTAEESVYQPPDLFYLYRDARNRKIPYSAGLVLSLKSVTDPLYLPRETSILPYEEFLLNQIAPVGLGIRRRGSFSTSLSLPIVRRGRSTACSLVNAAALGRSYLREAEERVVPPDAVVQGVKIKGRVTCVAFSHDAAILALGVTIGFEHVVQLRNSLEIEMRPCGTFIGHVGHIHHVTFRRDRQMLLSCSADKTVRVWRLDRPFVAMNASTNLRLNCLCTLPHEFPVYGGIFYQEHIITFGFDPRLFVWRYDRDLLDPPPELPSTTAAHLDLTGTLAVPIPVDVTEAVHGELISVANSAEDGAVIFSICATELNRIWSVDAMGNVVVWRAMYEDLKDGKQVWQMSVRHRFRCLGATRVEVYSTIALVTCAKTPMAYVFDATRYKLMHEISLHQRPYTPALALLPDGEAFVAGTCDGRLLSWECGTGMLCTARDGYSKAQVNFPIGRITWANGQQIAILVSNESGSGHTSVAVIGTPRTEATVILLSDPRAPDYFRARFGGELTAARRRSMHIAKPNLREGLVIVQSSADNNTQGTSLAARAAPTEDRSTRMGQIVSLWKGLVGQHRHAKEKTGEHALAASRDPAAPYTTTSS